MDEKLQCIDLQKVPNHIAIIMDGNGRWAKGKGMQRIFGHRNALTAIRETADTASEIGVKFITLYAFSTENWNRPKLEVDALMSLLVSTLKKELPDFQRKNVKINAIGNISSLPKNAQKVLANVIDQTKKQYKNHFNLCFKLRFKRRNC
jgi:undecaprenyl diphosphate synthase